MLFWPVVLEHNALWPRPIFSTPVVLDFKEKAPTAVLKPAVVLEHKATWPIATLQLPVVILAKAALPTAVL